MFKNAKIQGLMTTAQASELTGLTAHRIGCLARAGEIEAAKSGNTLLIDSASLQTYALAKQGRGRPMDVQTAYAALWMLSGLNPDWLSYAQFRRLRLRLATMSAEMLVWQLRKRAEVHHYRASESMLNKVANSIVLSGTSSNCLNDFELLQIENKVEGYCLINNLDKLKKSCFLTEDTSGNVIVHASAWLPNDELRAMPIAVVAADLAQSLITREREAGLNTLRRLLSEYRDI